MLNPNTLSETEHSNDPGVDTDLDAESQARLINVSPIAVAVDRGSGAHA
jgi:hypothetical protein